MSDVLPIHGACARGNRSAGIASAPIVALMEEIRLEAATIKRWSPNSDVASALALVADKLERALRQTQQTDTWLTVDEVQGLFHRPRSTITRICRDHGAEAGARKVKGVWTIHRPTFEAFLVEGPTSNSQEAA